LTAFFILLILYTVIMNIHIASDHAGFDMKELLKQYLINNHHQVTDHGAFSYDADDDYPDYITPCAQAVAGDTQSLGIILGGSGQGEQITANKVPGIRTIEYYGGNLEIVKLGREHNDANILSLGARFMSADEALTAVELFLSTDFSGDERHMRRINKIEK
jgi:ribose 5-phosphate isomerase B